MIPLNKKLPSGTKLKPYWRACLQDLHSRYAGVCAYTCEYISPSTGAASCDHFVPKSRRAGLAYEWRNYRLASLLVNARKCDFSGILDPFKVAPETFHLELITGHIFVNPALTGAQAKAAQRTIDRLGLDERIHREARARAYQDFAQVAKSEVLLRKYSPFVWYEANRQGLL